MQDVPYGYCQCGCGRQTKLSTKTISRRGVVKGQPLRFVNGHNGRGHHLEYEPRECGYMTPCWFWLRYRDHEGYGQAKRPDDRSTILAHVLVWERHNGPVPDGLTLDHLCRNKSCVNPAHLEPVTHAENTRRGTRAKLTHEAVAEIRRSLDDAYTLAKRFGVTPKTIYGVRRRDSWI